MPEYLKNSSKVLSTKKLNPPIPIDKLVPHPGLDLFSPIVHLPHDPQRDKVENERKLQLKKCHIFIM